MFTYKSNLNQIYEKSETRHISQIKQSTKFTSHVPQAIA